MGANLKTTFIVDVEATCWTTDPDQPWSEQQNGRPNEVIEIGIVALNLKDMGILQQASYLVKPRRTAVSKFCTELTGWTQQDVDGAPDILEVLSSIRRDFNITRHHTWWSYGEYDKYKLSSEPGNGSLFDLYGTISQEFPQSPFSQMRAHFNAKTLFAMKHNLQRELGMARAMNFLNLPLEGRHHNGLDDAVNITKIVKNILRG